MNAQMFLGKQIAIDKVKETSSSAGTLVTSSTVDMSLYDGADGVLFFTTIATANAGNYLSAQQSADDSSYAALEGSKVVAANNNEVVALDIFRPTDRYLQVTVTRAGANTVVGEIYALVYGLRKMPSTHATEVVIEYHATPAEGTV